MTLLDEAGVPAGAGGAGEVAPLGGPDFVAVDFETANARWASVCQVGLTRMRGGQIEAEESWLIRPPTGLDFDPFNIGIHGITPEMVTDARTWAQSLEVFEDFVGDLPLVAHNASFDRSVFTKATELIRQPVPQHRWECSVKLSRRHFRQLPNHKLPTVAAAVGAGDFQHHDACADARACALIVAHVARDLGVSDFNDLWQGSQRRTRQRT